MQIRAIALLLLPSVVLTQSRLPRYEDFPAPTAWSGSTAPLQLATAGERTFRSRLLQAAKGPANFAGHYRFTTWGCGSECISGAIVDLNTGRVLAPPLSDDRNSWMHFSVCQSAYENSGIEIRPDSRLLIVRCGLHYDVKHNRNVPDAYYFVLDNNRFRELAHVLANERRGDK